MEKGENENREWLVRMREEAVMFTETKRNDEFLYFCIFQPENEAFAVCVKDASHQNGEAIVVVNKRTIEILTCGKR